MNIRKGIKEYRAYRNSLEGKLSQFSFVHKLIDWTFWDYLKYTAEEREQLEIEEIKKLKELIKELE